MKSVSSLLRQSLFFYKTQANALLGYSAWLLLPYGGLLLLSLMGNAHWFRVGSVIIGLISTLLWLWVSIVLMQLIDAVHDKRPVDLLTIQSQAKPLMLPVLMVALLQTLALLGGLLLFVVPAFVFLVWFAFAQMSVVLDGKRTTAALVHSRALVRGRFFPMAWRLCCGPLMSLVLFSVVLSLVLLLFSQLTGAPIPETWQEPTPIWIDLLSSVSEIFFVPFLLTYWVLLYKDARDGKKE